MKITLRPFTETDIAACRQWAEDINAAQYQSRIFPRAFNGRDLSGREDLWAWFIIQVDGVDAGTVWLEKESPKKDKAILGILLGKKEFFGKGIGRQAVSLAIRQARESLGFNRVVLSVRKDNMRAIASYKHVGFTITSEGTSQDTDHTPIFVMTFELEAGTQKTGMVE